MIQDKSTLYSLAGSLAVNMMITMGAGSYLISINKSLVTQKTYKLDFVKRKAPPQIKKKKIRKEVVRKKIKVPVFQPKTTVRQTNSIRPSVSIPNYVPRQVQTQNAPAKQSAVKYYSSSIVSRLANVTIPTARSFSANKKSSNKEDTRVAMAPSHHKVHKMPKLMALTSATKSTAKNAKDRMTPVITGIKHASLSLQLNPRNIPNIVDRGALKGYIVRIQRIIENAKEYPEVSRKAGREGKLKVQFTIFRDGEVGNIKLLSRTPYPNLNREAMNAIKRAAPFSGFPDSLPENSMSVILPFSFELR